MLFAISVTAIWLSFPLVRALRFEPRWHFVVWMTGLAVLALLVYVDDRVKFYFDINKKISNIEIIDVYHRPGKHWQKLALSVLYNVFVSSWWLGISIALLLGRYWFRPFEGVGIFGPLRFSTYWVQAITLCWESFFVLTVWYLAAPLFQRAFGKRRSGTR